MWRSPVTAWHEQDDFWTTFSPVMFTERRWEGTGAEIDQILSLTGLEPGMQVLDLCCGPGRHSLELARRGFRVTGVDRTAPYLDQARQKAADEGLNVEWIQADMREFCRPDAFDAVLSMYTSFGYFEDPADDRTVAENICRSLRANGVVFLEMVGKEEIARRFQERTWSEEPDGTILLQERRIRPGWDLIENRWILIKRGKRKELSFAHRLYSGVEIKRLLTDSGFSKVDLYGSFEGAPYDHTAGRLVVLARKG